jgi:hypothetical protein
LDLPLRLGRAFAAARALDQSDVAELTVIAADSRLYVVRSFELRAVRPVEEVFRIVRVRNVVGLAPEPAALLRPQREWRIMIEAKILRLAGEEVGDPVEQFREQPPEAPSRKPNDSDHVAGVAARPVGVDHIVRPHLPELPERDAAANLYGDRRAVQTRHRGSSICRTFVASERGFVASGGVFVARNVFG